MKKNIDMVQVIGVAGSLLGVAATLLTNYSNEKKLDKLVEDKVKEALENQVKIQG